MKKAVAIFTVALVLCTFALGGCKKKAKKAAGYTPVVVVQQV